MNPNPSRIASLIRRAAPWSILPALVLLVSLALLSLGAGAADTTPEAHAPADLTGMIVDPVEDQSVYVNHVLGPVEYSLEGTGIAYTSTITYTSSSNLSLIGSGDVACGGTGMTRTVTITPTADMTGTAAITLTAYALTSTTPFTFDVTVEDVPPIHTPMVASYFHPGADLRVALVAGTYLRTLYSDREQLGNMIIVAVANYGTEPIDKEFWVDLYLEPSTPPTGPNQRWQDSCYYGAQWGITADNLPLDPGEYLLLATSEISVASLSDASTPDYFLPTFILPTESRIPSIFGEALDIYVQVDSVDMRTDYGSVLEYHENLGLPTNNISHGFFPDSMVGIGPLSMGASTAAAPTGGFVDEPPRE